MSDPSPNSLPSYGKPWLSYADQVAQLTAQGLTVTDLVYEGEAAIRLDVATTRRVRKRPFFSTFCLTYRLLRECPTAKDFAHEWTNRLHCLIQRR